MSELIRLSRNPDPNLYITILAGGIGSRFWPASIPDRPKQILPLASDNPLIIDTIARAQKVVPNDKIRILTGTRIAHLIQKTIPKINKEGLMIEPKARGTAPALAWAAWEIAQKDPSAILISLHVDHIISPESKFVDLMHATVDLVRQKDLLFTVAVKPTRCETGYGYIKPGKKIETMDGTQAFRVASFREKPNAETVESYLNTGHLWNSGIFVWRASTFLNELKYVAPEIADLIPLLEKNRIDEFFDRAPVMTVDVAVLERSDLVASVSATFNWDDLGNWEALMRNRKSDEKGNVVIGNGQMVESSRNLIYSPDGTVVAYGIEDLAIIQSGEITLVTRRDIAPNLKDLLDQIPPELFHGKSISDLEESPEEPDSLNANNS